jgi:hypothetical protein
MGSEWAAPSQALAASDMVQDQVRSGSSQKLTIQLEALFKLGFFPPSIALVRASPTVLPK